MIRSYIEKYLRRFCSTIDADSLCRLIENDQDVYPLWLKQFSDGEPSLPPFAYFFKEEIEAEIKETLREISPEHFNVFDVNPAWANRQLDGLLEELFR